MYLWLKITPVVLVYIDQVAMHWRWIFENWSNIYLIRFSPYFCVFKYARAVKQTVWNEAENRERDWGETLSPHTPYGHVRLARFARLRLLRLALRISLLILRKNRQFCSLWRKRKSSLFYAFIVFISETFWLLWREVCIPIKKKGWKQKVTRLLTPQRVCPKRDHLLNLFWRFDNFACPSSAPPIEFYWSPCWLTRQQI